MILNDVPVKQNLSRQARQNWTNVFRFSTGSKAALLKAYRDLWIGDTGQPSVKLKLKLKTNLYSAIKSEDSESLDGGTSQLRSQREYGEIKMF